jgi:hypothetical protein
MPAVFIHVVNTREEDAGYSTDLAARDELIHRLILAPLAEAKGEPFAGMEVANVYWGKHGVQFYWNQATVPEVGMLQSLGPGEAMPGADLEMATTVAELAKAAAPGGSTLEPLGGGEGPLCRAARADLVRFVEAVISPVIHSEFALDEDGELSPQASGACDAVLAVAAYEVATDPAVRGEVERAGSDDEVMDLLKSRIGAHFQKLLDVPGAGRPAGAPSAELEGLGSHWFAALRERVGVLFDRARSLPGRLASTTLLDLYRERLHNRLTRFLGDVFIYLKERDEGGGPSPIIRAVLEQIRGAPRQRADEPLLILTHSSSSDASRANVLAELQSEDTFPDSL